MRWKRVQTGSPNTNRKSPIRIKRRSITFIQKTDSGASKSADRLEELLKAVVELLRRDSRCPGSSPPKRSLTALGISDVEVCCSARAGILLRVPRQKGELCLYPLTNRSKKDQPLPRKRKTRRTQPHRQDACAAGKADRIPSLQKARCRNSDRCVGAPCSWP